MDCLSKKLFKHFQTYYGKKINACEKDFHKGDFKFIITSLIRTLNIVPEDFLDTLLIASANIGNNCFKDNQEEKLKLYNRCVFTAKKYKIDLPKEVELLVKEDKPKVSLFNKIKSIFKK
tara:strand:+ start:1602 stop:1958 length:357 start_codon:yes stop_codon:yes gene_type:complete